MPGRDSIALPSLAEEICVLLDFSVSVRADPAFCPVLRGSASNGRFRPPAVRTERRRCVRRHAKHPRAACPGTTGAMVYGNPLGPAHSRNHAAQWPRPRWAAIVARKRDAALRGFLKGKARATEGPLFRWLWNHHAEVDEGLRQHRVGWAAILEWVEREGVTGKLGGKPSRTGLLKVWARVLREREAAAVARATALPKRKPPNRSPRLNQPPSFVAAPPLHPTPAAAPEIPPERAPALAFLQRIGGDAPFAPLAPTPVPPAPQEPTPTEIFETLMQRLANKDRGPTRDRSK